MALLTEVEPCDVVPIDESNMELGGILVVLSVLDHHATADRVSPAVLENLKDGVDVELGNSHNLSRVRTEA